LMVVVCVLLVTGLLVGIRWHISKGSGQIARIAREILQQRNARGEINKDEFEAKKKDLTT